MPKLNLDRDQIDRCRELAESIARPIQRYIEMHSTVSIERAVLRLLGFTGSVDLGGHAYPSANVIVDKSDKRLLKNGAAALIAAARKQFSKLSQEELAEKIVKQEIDPNRLEELPPDKAQQILKPWIDSAFRHVDRLRYKKEEMREMGNSGFPLKCVRIGTGSAQEDVAQARVFARAGADGVLLTRSTAQSLLDYLPGAETAEGYGGTFFTPTNLRLLRDALDEVSRELGRYIRIGADSHGLCMPEIAVTAAYEGADTLLNDTFYGALFRDINIKRTLIDQHFSRLITSRSGIVIHTGEENYFGSIDAYDAHPIALVSHFLNEQFAKNTGLRDEIIGFSHALDMDPTSEDSFIHETAMAQLVREIFPRSPLRYMPPSRESGVDFATQQAVTVLHCLAGTLTGQIMQVVGPSPNAAHALEERLTALKSANLVFAAARSFNTEVGFTTNGKIMRRARSILEVSEKTLSRIKDRGLFDAFDQGVFADMPRSKDGGRGYDGVFEKSRRYFNPFLPQSGGRDSRER